MNMKADRSPLKANPLPNAGDSIQKYIHKITDDNKLFPLEIAFTFSCIAGFQWYYFLTGSPPNPIPWTIIAFLAIGYAFFSILRANRKLKNLRLGRDGEKAVGQYLELLREKGAKVFHDCPADHFNIDHVVIHSTGIYVIETKTFTFPRKSKPVIQFDGINILVNGMKPERDAITQVISTTVWLSELLREMTGKQFPIRPVVLFPGWFIKQTKNPEVKQKVWVLNPKALPKFIENEQPQMSASDIHLASFNLSRYIRTQLPAKN